MDLSIHKFLFYGLINALHTWILINYLIRMKAQYCKYKSNNAGNRNMIFHRSQIINFQKERLVF